MGFVLFLFPLNPIKSTANTFQEQISDQEPQRGQNGSFGPRANLEELKTQQCGLEKMTLLQKSKSLETTKGEHPGR